MSNPEIPKEQLAQVIEKDGGTPPPAPPFIPLHHPN